MYLTLYPYTAASWVKGCCNENRTFKILCNLDYRIGIP